MSDEPRPEELDDQAATDSDAVETVETVEELQHTLQEHRQAIIETTTQIDSWAVDIETRKTQVANDAETVATVRGSVAADSEVVAQLRQQSETDREQIIEDLAATNVGRDSCAAALKSAKDYETELSDLASEADSLKDQINTGTTKLNELQAETTKLRETIDGLLPGATSAGLATAFKEQKETYRVPQMVFAGVFVVCVIALVAVAMIDPSKLVLGEDALSKVTGWQHFGISIVTRLPVAGPIVWLALVALKQFGVAKRLMDDFAQKETLSISFQGYKRELMEIAKENQDAAPLIHHCENVLTTLSLHPVRLYSGKHDEPTPLKSATDAVKEIADVVNTDK